MPKQILFIQGAGEGTHEEWDDKLVASLESELGEQYAIRYPKMPEADPSYSSWKSALLRELDDLDDGAMVVGHSIGGTLLIQALAEPGPKRNLKAVLLIAAPFFGGGGWPSDETDSSADLAGRLPPGMPVFLYQGTADDIVPFEHLQLYAKAIPQAAVRALADRDHQLNNDLSDVARDIRNGI
jgi:predicted alpha/beta hydrolase family esterase